MTMQMTKRTRRYAMMTAAICYGLAACGGGSGDAPSSPALAVAVPGTPVATLPVPVATAAPAVPVGAAPAALPVASPAVASAIGDISCGLNGVTGIEAEVLQRVNVLRASGAVCGATAFTAAPDLAWNNALLLAAKGHSADMAQKNYFSHTSQDGRNAGQRITAAGYNWSSYGENIAAGQRTVEQVMNGWINSPGHCQNLMNPNFRDVAVACVRNDMAEYRLYWTMALGRSR